MRLRVPSTIGQIVTNGYRAPVRAVLLMPPWSTEDTSTFSCGRRKQLGQSDQVVGGAREDHQPLDVRETAEFHLAQPADRFQPAERRLDAGSGVLTHRVARVPRHAAVDRTAAWPIQILRNMGRAAQLA